MTDQQVVSVENVPSIRLEFAPVNWLCKVAYHLPDTNGPSDVVRGWNR